MARCFDEADAVDSPIGYLPKAEDINLEGLDLSLDTLKGLLNVDTGLWKEEVAGIKTVGDLMTYLQSKLDA